MNERRSENPEKPEVFSLKKQGALWTISRRGLFQGTGASAALLAVGCSDKDDPDTFGGAPPLGKGHTHEITGLVLLGDILYSSGIDGKILSWKVPDGTLLGAVCDGEKSGGAGWAWEELAGAGDELAGISGYPPELTVWKVGDDPLTPPRIRSAEPLAEFDYDLICRPGEGILYTDHGRLTHRVQGDGDHQFPPAEPLERNVLTMTHFGGDPGFLAYCIKDEDGTTKLKVTGQTGEQFEKALQLVGVTHLAAVIPKGKSRLGNAIVAMCDEEGNVEIAGAGGEKMIEKGDRGAVDSLEIVYGEGRHWLAVGYASGRILLADLGESGAHFSFEAHAGAVNHLRAIPQHEMLASGGADKAVRLWKIRFPSGADDPDSSGEDPIFASAINAPNDSDNGDFAPPNGSDSGSGGVIVVRQESGIIKSGKTVSGGKSPPPANVRLAGNLTQRNWTRPTPPDAVVARAKPTVSSRSSRVAGAGGSATPGGISQGGMSPGGVSPGGVSPGGVSPGGVSPGGVPRAPSPGTGGGGSRGGYTSHYWRPN